MPMPTLTPTCRSLTPSRRRGLSAVATAGLLALSLVRPVSAAEPPSSGTITLDQALALARGNNARLPVAALDVRIADQSRAEALSRRKIRLGIEGDLSIAPRGGYDPAASDLGQDRLQAVAERPLYDGGRLAAEERRAGARADAARAQYRQAEADVELEVRTRYAELLAARREAAVREDGLKRLRSYLDLLASRGAAGQPIESDLLRGRLRAASEDAARQAALDHADRARSELNTLMGRPPSAPLDPAPLPPPTAPSTAAAPADASEPAPSAEAQAEPPSGGTGGTATAGGSEGGAAPRLPEVAIALHEVDAARAGLEATRAEHRPTLSLRADAGLWGTDTTRLVPPDLRAGDPNAGALDRLDRDLGLSVTLDLAWPLFDSGGRQARQAQAQLALDRARQRVVAEQTAARRDLTVATDARARAYARLEILRQAMPQARDAYLDATSRYLGGAASYLDVVDAFDASIATGVEEAQATLDYYLAEAQVIRWGGTP